MGLPGSALGGILSGGRSGPDRGGRVLPGLPETGCPGRPAVPVLAGLRDVAPARAPAAGRELAGGFTRAPGGSGFQFGLTTSLAGRDGAAAAGRAAAGFCAIPAGTTGAAGFGGIAAGAAGFEAAAGDWAGVFAAAGTAGAGGAERAGATSLVEAGAVAEALTGATTGAAGGFAAADGLSAAAGGETGAGGGGGAAGLVRAAFAAASFAAFSEAALDSSWASASARSRKCFRTLTAASTSIELECVFFSVTPASGK